MATATMTTAIINTLLPLDEDEFSGAEEKSIRKEEKFDSTFGSFKKETNYL